MAGSLLSIESWLSIAEHQGEPAFLLSALCLEVYQYHDQSPQYMVHLSRYSQFMFEQTNGIICIHEFYLWNRLRRHIIILLVNWNSVFNGQCWKWDDLWYYYWPKSWSYKQFLSWTINNYLFLRAGRLHGTMAWNWNNADLSILIWISLVFLPSLSIMHSPYLKVLTWLLSNLTCVTQACSL